MTIRSPLLWISAFFTLGVIICAAFGIETALAFVFVLFIAATVRALMIKRLRFVFVSVVLALVFSFGAIRFYTHDDIKRKDLYPYINQTVTLFGEVKDKPVVTEKRVRFLLSTTSVQIENGEKSSVDGKLYISVFKNQAEESAYTIPKRGDVVSLECELTIPDAALNRGGFDYREYLKTKGVFFQATANPQTIRVVGHKDHFFLDAHFKFRAQLLSMFDKTFPTKEASVLKAYILGDMTNADETVTEWFSDSGLSHALAVSGAHVVVFLSILTAFLKLVHIGKRKQLFISSVAVLFFVVFTGASVSAIRAGFVGFLTVFAQLFYRRSDPLTALTESAAVFCLFSPHVFMDASFLLSFGATYGILLFNEPLAERMSFLYKKFNKGSVLYVHTKNVVDLITVGISAQIFVIPIMIYLFQTVSFLSVVATIVINQLLAPALAGGLLFCAIGLVSPVLSIPLAGFIFVLAKLMLLIAKLFAQLPFSHVSFGLLTPFIIGLYVLTLCFIYFLFIKKNRTGIYASGLALLCFFTIFCVRQTMMKDVMQLSFINVGQGDCALIKAPNDCDILIDAGGKEGDCSVGEDTIRPYLLKSGVYDIEYAVISHGHIDHMGGMLTLMDQMKIKRFIVPDGFGRTDEAQMLLKKAKEKHIPISVIMSGDFIDFQNGLKLFCILPDSLTNAYIDAEDENNHSSVIKFCYGETSVLFTGDVEKDVAEYLAETRKDELKADILKVPHHGAKTSASETFLSEVNPAFAVIPVGKNTYGHPHEETLNMLTNKKVITYRTDQNRDITFYISTEKIKGIVADKTGGLK